MEDIRFVPNNHGAILSLNKHRKRLLYTINLICIIAIVPFAILSLIHSYIWLGVCLLAFVATLVINTICVIQRGREYFHHVIVMSFLIAALTLAVHHRGVGAVFWVFPVVATSIFVLPMRAALFFSVTLTASVSILMFMEMTHTVAIRASLSLVITIAINYVVVNIIQELQQKLRRSSEEDPLTGLSNRRQLDNEIMAVLDTYTRDGHSAVILLIDIDRFKTINDSFGHDVGDRIIQSVANAIKDNTRKSDAVFRLGGDEFLVLLNGIDWSEGSVIAETIRSKIEKLSEPEAFPVSASIGASVVYDGADKSAWIKQADAAMYQAKINGRNCVHIYQDT
ncbi:GGDEF domain-containing protein [Pseudoteredinibacter isoporae]|uniref:diguanylate cyclase n=1 Tax=Pseudoteredinibacter isoporae TaxID=570281 RepID=A0A7X0MV29_9GAMM|nr:GGDEF domain-containing protein [Pseudoteredinibacter isoporae]MBB6521296.1 diguanylate cyclase (GGDEF)-like protein [Pseudoteredinibacter isoporae]NHO86854.1 GGDEF domain-containing protein [Pseudoteredinibacter isoporae]NIB24694.1 GGDEF domain-containing protein [Pseudoteredinibacter isoporae]